MRGESDFLARHDVPALVARGGLGAQPASFVTRWSQAPGHHMQGPAEDDQEVFFVEKRQGAPFPERIGVGRAPNVDIVVRRDGISKYHAYFVCDSGRDYQLADAGSKNGTFLGHQRLSDRSPEPVSDGNLVRFGTESFIFLLPRSLVELLRDGLR